MNRLKTRNITVGIGMGLILIGIVWACLKIGSPGQLSAASGPKSLSSLKRPAKKPSVKSPQKAILTNPTNETTLHSPVEPEPLPETSSDDISFNLNEAPPISEEEPIFLNASGPDPTPSPSKNISPSLNGNAIPLPGDKPVFESDSFPELSPELPEADLETLPDQNFDSSPLSDPNLEVSPAPLPAPLPQSAPAKLANRQSEREAFPAPILTGSARPGDVALEGPQKAEIILSKEVPSEVQLGSETTFKIHLKNVGKSVAHDVTLRDAIPAGTRLTGTQPEAESTPDGQLVWTSFNMKPEEERVFECRFIPESEGEIGSLATVSFAAEASGRTVCTRPRLKLTVSAPPETLIGDKVKFDIEISNPGTGTAKNVTLLENVPEGLEHSGGRTLNNVIGDIKPGEIKKLALSLRTSAPGVIANLMTVTADANLKEEVTTEIKVNAPELALEIEGPKQRYLQRDAAYHLKVWNPGSAAAKGVKLIAELPKGMEFVRTNNEGVYHESTNAVYWELVELPQNIAPGEIELVLKPTAIGTDKLVFRGEGDLHLTATTEQEVIIDGISALTYRIATLTDTVETGGEALFEITIANKGTKESTNVNLAVTLPGGMEAIEADGPTRYSQEEGTLLFLPIAKLAPKEEMVYKLKTRCGVAGDSRIRAEVSSDEMEPLMKEESVRVY